VPHGSSSVGRVEVTALCDGVVLASEPSEDDFPGASEVVWAETRERYPDVFGEQDRWRLHVHCFVLRSDGRTVLVDTGIGNKDDAKFRAIYGVENAGAGGRTLLEDALASLGHLPEDVRWVINTHLHFDHAGGNTVRNPAGEVGPSFPRAHYVVQRGELEFAHHTNERTAASYLVPNFASIDFQLVDGETEVLPGIRCLPTPGHVPFHQSVLVESGGERACFLADLVPTAAHLPLAWIMGYDLEPLVTLETRRRVYSRAEAEGWRLCFEHDPVVTSGRLGRDGKGVRPCGPCSEGIVSSPRIGQAGADGAPPPGLFAVRGERSRVRDGAFNRQQSASGFAKLTAAR